MPDPTSPPVTPADAAHAARVNSVVAFAETLPAQADALAKVDPALAAQLTGSLQTYLRAGASPVAVGIAGWIVGQAVGFYGMACTATVTTSCWSPEFVNGVANVLAVVGTAAGAVIMHWWSKAPFRAVVAATPGAK